MKRIILISILYIITALSVFGQQSNYGVRASLGVFTEMSINSRAARGSDYTLSYVKPIDIFRSEVDFIEVSPELTFTNINKYLELAGESGQFKSLSITIPVSFVYKACLGDFALRAHVGFGGKINMMAKVFNSSDSYNILSKDEYGKILQAVLLGGVGGEYKNVYLGLSYHYDVTPLYSYESSKWRIGTLRLSLGYSF